MSAYSLTHLSDQTLLAELAVLVTADRHTTAAVLAHIAEVDARALYLPAACSSMHVYCTRVLHLAEDAAFKRIRAARAARRFPPIFGAIADVSSRRSTRPGRAAASPAIAATRRSRSRSRASTTGSVTPTRSQTPVPRWSLAW